MTEQTGLTFEELEAETGEELPPRELMACVVVSAGVSPLGVGQTAFACYTIG